MGLLTEISSGKKRPVIEPTGKPPAVVAGEQAGGGDLAEEKNSCSHIRTKKILLIGNYSTGELNWGDVEHKTQCVECGAIFLSGGQFTANGEFVGQYPRF